jgi:hypothetical protein
MSRRSLPASFELLLGDREPAHQVTDPARPDQGEQDQLDPDRAAENHGEGQSCEHSSSEGMARD